MSSRGGPKTALIALKSGICSIWSRLRIIVESGSIVIRASQSSFAPPSDEPRFSVRAGRKAR